MTVFENMMHSQEYVWDFDVDGGATGEIVLSSKAGFAAMPTGAIVKDVQIWVEDAATSGGSATLTVGDSNDPNGYLEAIAVAALTTNITHRAGSYAGANIWDDTNDHMLSYVIGTNSGDSAISVTIAVAAMTAGKIRVILDYYMPRSNP